MLLQADELIYNNDEGTVSALGNVRIDYDGSKLVARQVTYIQETGRMIAIGDVEILQPDGTRLIADEIDITDDFRDGFLNALRVVTPDNTRFVAESAERRDGNITVFNRGIYTACEPCEEQPEKPPLWQIKSQRTVWNAEEKTVRFEHARFEFLGIPIAYLPVFTTADPTVKRKTGFLAPSFRYAEELGFGVRVPFFINLAPNYDLTLTGTGFTRQGFLGEAEFRHRLHNGIYNLKVAGIQQQQPNAFGLGTEDRLNPDRGMIGTSGEFRINPRWQFGWNGMLQSDKNFSRTYSIAGFNEEVFRNEAWLTGLSGQNFFDTRVMHFDVQESTLDPAGRNTQQPNVLPSTDYNYVLSRPVAGGQLSFNVNTRGIVRETAETRLAAGPADNNFATFGTDGSSWRFTAETEWKRTYTTLGGLLITPILHAQGDNTVLDVNATGPLSQTMETNGTMLAGNGTHWRGMATAGLETRLPLLVTAAGTSHVFEPIAQVFVRPDAPNNVVLPNEDAQSLVFDASTLFDRDKFSGYDRIEGGIRANVGIRYSGMLGENWSTTGVFGQSYHLAGDNPYDDADIVNAGADSGLETARSDYVAHAGVRHRSGFAASVDGRFDETDFELRRADAGVSFSNATISLATNYAMIKAQPTYGFNTDRQEISGSGSLRLTEYWRALGSVTYDISNDRMTSRSIGLAYDDECFHFGFSYTETVDTADAITRTFGITFAARTLGDFGITSSGLDL
ncbi:MAG: LPS-assembly protein LptD [Roseitalea sp.]|nr:LPS-assembly protein LptD [Roseitalea sp.]MBO6723027.1 LPS-assembly protein LptD [Roseitalea sp.]MBO6744065.1 LPS-assembly protein LptD [Roseitalea sp.]